MTDEAERWLRDHDPDYARSRNAWRHIRDEDCPSPGQEIPWGDENDLERLGRGDVVPVEDALCERCGGPFSPVTPWQKFCSGACRQGAYRHRVTHSQ